MKKAFTLIELLVVVLIIGILAAIALPQYERAVEKSRLAEAKIILRHIADAQRAYYMTNGKYSENLDELGVDIPGKDVPSQEGRKDTNSFRYAAYRMGNVENTIAFASRLPYNTDYELYIKADDGKIVCAQLSDTAAHAGICKYVD